MYRCVYYVSYVIQSERIERAMSKMVSARIPDAMYEQANHCLQELKSSPSELIKAAFDYLIEHQTLPPVQNFNDAKQNRELDYETREHLKQAFRSCTLGVNYSNDINQEKEEIRSAKVSKYEALA